MGTEQPFQLNTMHRAEKQLWKMDWEEYKNSVGNFTTPIHETKPKAQFTPGHWHLARRAPFSFPMRVAGTSAGPAPKAWCQSSWAVPSFHVSLLVFADFWGLHNFPILHCAMEGGHEHSSSPGVRLLSLWRWFLGVLDPDFLCLFEVSPWCVCVSGWLSSLPLQVRSDLVCQLCLTSSCVDRQLLCPQCGHCVHRLWVSVPLLIVGRTFHRHGSLWDMSALWMWNPTAQHHRPQDSYQPLKWGASLSFFPSLVCRVPNHLSKRYLRKVPLPSFLLASGAFPLPMSFPGELSTCHLPGVFQHAGSRAVGMSFSNSSGCFQLPMACWPKATASSNFTADVVAITGQI